MMSRIDLLRYTGHIALKELGAGAHMALQNAKVLVIGLGGLGCPALMYLSSSGVGALGLLDDDTVEISNLQRQILYTTADLGQKKAHCAQQFIYKHNPEVVCNAIVDRLTEDNAKSIIGDYNVIIDAVDNFRTRELIAETAYELRKPMILSAITQFKGYITTFHHGSVSYSPALTTKDLFQTVPLDQENTPCSLHGVFSPVGGVLGALIASETIKVITQSSLPLYGKLLTIDLQSMRFTCLSYF